MGRQIRHSETNPMRWLTLRSVLLVIGFANAVNAQKPFAHEPNMNFFGGFLDRLTSISPISGEELPDAELGVLKEIERAESKRDYMNAAVLYENLAASMVLTDREKAFCLSKIAQYFIYADGMEWEAIATRRRVVKIAEAGNLSDIAFLADIEIARLMADTGGVEGFDPSIDEMREQFERVFRVYPRLQGEIIGLHVKIGQEYGYHFTDDTPYVKYAIEEADEIEQLAAEARSNPTRAQGFLATLPTAERNEALAFCVDRAKEIRERADTFVKGANTRIEMAATQLCDAFRHGWIRLP
jgi:hypothetical protein